MENMKEVIETLEKMIWKNELRNNETWKKQVLTVYDDVYDGDIIENLIYAMDLVTDYF